MYQTMQITPKVSVVIPTHNRPRLLERALASVRAQTMYDLEVIVVDDGDRETGAEEVVRSCGDERIRYVAQPQAHQGAPAARNRGARESRADYIAFLDDDDAWLPYKLERQVARMLSAADDIGFCFSAVINVYDDGREVLTEVEDGSADFSEIALRRFNGFMTSTCFMRRSAFDAVGGFDEAFPSHQEAELIIRLTQCYKGIGMSEPLVRMSMSQSHTHIGGDVERRIKGREMLLAKHEELYELRPHTLAQQKYWLAFMYRDAGRKSEALAAFQDAWRLHKKLRYALRYLVLRIVGR